MAKITEEEILDFCNQNSLIKFLGVKIVPLENLKVRLELFVGERHTNPYGLLHGGMMATLVDTAMGAACMLKNKRVVTISMTVDFMHAVPIGSRIMTRARVLHNGKKTVNCECEIIDASGKIYVKVLALFFVTGNFV